MTDPIPQPSNTTPHPSERRSHGRLAVKDAECSHGTILDVSAGGMRLLARRRLRGTHRLIVRASDRSLAIHARVAWCQRQRWGRYAVGMQFLNVTPEARRELLFLRSETLVAPAPGAGTRRDRTVAPPGASHGLVVVGGLLGVVGAWGVVLIAPGIGDVGTIAALGVGGASAAAALSAVTQGPARVRLPRGHAQIEQLRAARQLLSRLLHSSLDGVVFLREVGAGGTRDSRLEFQIVNPAAGAILGRAPETLLGLHATHDMEFFRETPALDDARSVLATGIPARREARLASRDRWIDYSISRVPNGLLLTLADATDRRRDREMLQKLAYQDPLTGLANRKRLIDCIQERLGGAPGGSGRPFAAMFLDFDRFKVVNDSLGHDVGDRLLLSIASRLRAHMGISADAAERPGALLARLGGDEFVAILDGASRADAERACDDLLAALRVPHDLAEHSIVSTASIGLVVADAAHRTPDQVLRDADTAMYEAKSRGRAQWATFDPRMHRRASERLAMENDLRRALASREFELVYEPILETESCGVFAAEALLRWRHPTRGNVPPDRFLPLAEEIGLMLDLGEWILAEACEHAVRLAEKCRREPRLVIAVNLSRAEVLQADAADRVERVIRASGVDPRFLCIEIPETLITLDLERARALIAALKRVGVLVALDDFGTGNSALHAVQQLPIDILKLDRLLVGTDKSGLRQSAVINAAIELARHLNLRVVAEGVERPEQLALLQTLGCGYVQGRLFGAERSAAELPDLADARPRLRLAA